MTNKPIKLKDIAEAAGVDVSTVSLCLNNSPKVAEKTKKRIKELAESMNYSPNLIAKALRGGKSNTVGICLYSLYSNYFNTMLMGMQSTFYEKEYFPLVTSIRHSDSKWIMKNLLQRNVDGICLCNASQYFHLYENFKGIGKPISLYIQKKSLADLKDMKANYAICDFSEGTRKIFDHLFSLNHRRISFIGVIPNRFYDYCTILHEKNIELDEKLVINHWDSSEEFTKQILSMMKSPNPPTAIFANSDDVAINVMHVLLDNGCRVPEDVSLVGINDLTFSEMLRIPLTTLKVPVTRIGEGMAEMLVNQIQNPDLAPQKRYFDTELVIRKSTAAI